MHKIVAFGASNHSLSINQQLANWSASQIGGAKVKMLDLNDYEMPIYSPDRDKKDGIPAKAHQFKNELKAVDGIIISFAEYNGSYTAAFKNIYDWSSRIERPMWLNKPMMLMSTTPGPRGGQRVLEIALRDFPHQGAIIQATFSLPSFGMNFDPLRGIIDMELKKEFDIQIQIFQDQITKMEPTVKL